MDPLPDEIVSIIITNATTHELTQLSRASKRLYRLSEPLLWTNIEFHHHTFHEACDLKQPSPMISASQRFYHCDTEYPGQCKSENFFEMLQDLLLEDIGRLKQLCSRVESICTVVRPRIDVWQILPYFTNLKTLELYGDPSYFDQEKHRSFCSSDLTLRKLRYAKLDGCIPTAVVKWILESCSTVERLELGLLDKPIESRETMGDNFPRLPEDIYSPPEDPTYGRLRGWAAIPRPLSGFLPCHKDAQSLRLPRLRHLHLCQTSQSKLSARMVSYFWSTSAEVSAHKDWDKILQASCETLETLSVQQQIGIENGDGAVDDAEGFFRSDQDGLGSERLLNMLQGALTKRKFPALKRVYLKGIVVGSKERGEPIEDVHGGRFMRFLEKKGIASEARLGEGCWFDGDDGTGPPAEWGARDDDWEEELLASVDGQL
ncbi:hypothetical protein FAGAP_1648 [Fusarium agapanthi]|uniref:F-box domain-containing protein n=1 Tax=Fusarium agapanthi TaxID=1803897 RepID=A0A9P5BI30_9HYPO|nr:hypothetical protein FAGAP_1648 [Fusarium agapanthi]